MSPVLAVVPFHGRGEEASAFINATMAANILVVGVQNNLVRSRNLNADSVVGIALGGVEIENEDNAGPLKDDDLVSLMLERDVCLWRRQPTVVLLRGVHETIKVVEELIAKEVIISQV